MGNYTQCCKVPDEVGSDKDSDRSPAFGKMANQKALPKGQTLSQYAVKTFGPDCLCNFSKHVNID